MKSSVCMTSGIKAEKEPVRATVTMNLPIAVIHKIFTDEEEKLSPTDFIEYRCFMECMEVVDFDYTAVGTYQMLMTPATWFWDIARNSQKLIPYSKEASSDVTGRIEKDIVPVICEGNPDKLKERLCEVRKKPDYAEALAYEKAHPAGCWKDYMKFIHRKNKIDIPIWTEVVMDILNAAGGSAISMPDYERMLLNNFKKHFIIKGFITHEGYPCMNILAENSENQKAFLEKESSFDLCNVTMQYKKNVIIAVCEPVLGKTWEDYRASHKELILSSEFRKASGWNPVRIDLAVIQCIK